MIMAKCTVSSSIIVSIVLMAWVSETGRINIKTDRILDVDKDTAETLAQIQVVAPNLLSSETAVTKGLWEYKMRFAGWSYSNNLEQPVDNVYASKNSEKEPNKFKTNFAKFAERMASMPKKATSYMKSLVWLEDIGRSKLAQMVKGPACTDVDTVKRCDLGDGFTLCTRPYDDPSPWCEQAKQPSELLGPKCESTSHEVITKEYRWEATKDGPKGYLNSMNKGQDFIVAEDMRAGTTDGCLGLINHESLGGEFAVAQYPIPTLANRKSQPQTMPLRQLRTKSPVKLIKDLFAPGWTKMKLPIASYKGIQLRTGIAGKGQLGRWGPNFAADPVITRFNPLTGKAEVALGIRGDSGLMALPGGMVEPGDNPAKTVLKEFIEEVMGDDPALDPESLASTCFDKIGNPGKSGSMIRFWDCAFVEMVALCIPEKGQVIYQGIVDDPRNTDNAWMETTAMWVHTSDCAVGPHATKYYAQESSKEEQLLSKTTYGVEDLTPTVIAMEVHLTPATDINAANFRPLTAMNLHEDLYASHGYMLRGVQRHFKAKEQ